MLDVSIPVGTDAVGVTNAVSTNVEIINYYISNQGTSNAVINITVKNNTSQNVKATIHCVALVIEKGFPMD